MNRRNFVQSSAALATAPLLPFSMSVADAAGITPSADESGYKALVCVFLFGGNDSHNMLVPYQSAEYNAYQTARDGDASRNGLALPYGSLLPVSPTNIGANTLALHPAMPRMQGLFNAAGSKLAFVANTAPMLRPTSLAQYRQAGFELPPQLFSHSDMQMHWQTMIPDQPADTGWGGRMADVFRVASSGRLPVSIGLGSGGIFMKGDIASPYNIIPVRYQNGAINPQSTIARTPTAAIYWNWTGSKPQDVYVANNIATRANLLEQQFASTSRASLEVGEFVKSAMYNTDANGNNTFKNAVPGTWPTTNPLSAQLHAVASMIAARSALGTSRQIFFVTLGGFDNHGDQFGTTGGKTLVDGTSKHFKLLSWVDEALKTFYDSTVAMGVSSNVTTMTMSDFGRTMKSNGAGSDHGWGGHQIVMGGAVNGGQVYGQFPFPTALSTVDVGEGRLLPTLAADVYSARMAQWFGADPTELGKIFPNLNRFDRTPLNTLLA